jgi:hypothetical protein
MAREAIEKRLEKDQDLARAVTETVPAVGGGGRAPTKHERGKRVEALDKAQGRDGAGKFAGHGPSRAFVAEPGTFEETHDWSQLTLNGQAIPEHLWARLPYSMTDQGAEEYNAGKPERTVEVLRDAPLSSQTADELLRTMNTRTIEQSVDQFRESLELMQQEDPLGVLMKRHTPEGHRGLFMSQRRCDEAGRGLRRGVLDYQVVLVDGQRVQHGGMFLASVPEEKALIAEAYYARLTREQTQAAIAQVTEARDQVMEAAGIRRQNRRGDLPDEGIEFLDGAAGAGGADAARGGMHPGEYGRSFKG